MELDIPKPDYEAIGELIASEDSPVGIDAKKTHIIILHKLLEIERRINKIERMLK